VGWGGESGRYGPEEKESSEFSHGEGSKRKPARKPWDAAPHVHRQYQSTETILRAGLLAAAGQDGTKTKGTLAITQENTENLGNPNAHVAVETVKTRDHGGTKNSFPTVCHPCWSGGKKGGREQLASKSILGRVVQELIQSLQPAATATR